MSADKTVSELSQDLQIELLHLASFLSVIYGNGLSSFDDLSDEIRDNYLWGCADKARECERKANLLSRCLVGNEQKVAA